MLALVNVANIENINKEFKEKYDGKWIEVEPEWSDRSCLKMKTNDRFNGNSLRREYTLQIIGDTGDGRTYCTYCNVIYLYGDICPICKVDTGYSPLDKFLDSGSIKDFTRSAILRALPIKDILYTGER